MMTSSDNNELTTSSNDKEEKKKTDNELVTSLTDDEGELSDVSGDGELVIDLGEETSNLKTDSVVKIHPRDEIRYKPRNQPETDDKYLMTSSKGASQKSGKSKNKKSSKNELLCGSELDSGEIKKNKNNTSSVMTSSTGSGKSSSSSSSNRNHHKKHKHHGDGGSKPSTGSAGANASASGQTSVKSSNKSSSKHQQQQQVSPGKSPPTARSSSQVGAKSMNRVVTSSNEMEYSTGFRGSATGGAVTTSNGSGKKQKKMWATTSSGGSSVIPVESSVDRSAANCGAMKRDRKIDNDVITTSSKKQRNNEEAVKCSVTSSPSSSSSTSGQPSSELSSVTSQTSTSDNNNENYNKKQTDTTTTTSSSDDVIEKRTVGTMTFDAGTMTVPEELGPCEPGTSVILEGIVWHETDQGVLVLNITWRGRNYIGTLMDVTKHEWAPPQRVTDSDLDSSEIRGKSGRSKRQRNGGADSVGLGSGNNSSRKGRSRANVTNDDVKASPAKRRANKNVESPAAEVVASTTNGGVAEERSSAKRARLLIANNAGSQRTITPTPTSSTPTSSNEQRQTAPSRGGSISSEGGCSSPELFDCNFGNCSKRYKQLKGLEIHQAAAHHITSASNQQRSETKKNENNDEERESKFLPNRPTSSASNQSGKHFNNDVVATNDVIISTNDDVIDKSTTTTSSTTNRKIEQQHDDTMTSSVGEVTTQVENESDLAVQHLLQSESKSQDDQFLPGLSTPYSQDTPHPTLSLQRATMTSSTTDLPPRDQTEDNDLLTSSRKNDEPWQKISSISGDIHQASNPPSSGKIVKGKTVPIPIDPGHSCVMTSQTPGMPRAFVALGPGGDVTDPNKVKKLKNPQPQFKQLKIDDVTHSDVTYGIRPPTSASESQFHTAPSSENYLRHPNPVTPHDDRYGKMTSRPPMTSLNKSLPDITSLPPHMLSGKSENLHNFNPVRKIAGKPTPVTVSGTFHPYPDPKKPQTAVSAQAQDRLRHNRVVSPSNKNNNNKLPAPTNRVPTDPIPGPQKARVIPMQGGMPHPSVSSFPETKPASSSHHMMTSSDVDPRDNYKQQQQTNQKQQQQSAPKQNRPQSPDCRIIEDNQTKTRQNRPPSPAAPARTTPSEVAKPPPTVPPPPAGSTAPPLPMRVNEVLYQTSPYQQLMYGYPSFYQTAIPSPVDMYQAFAASQAQAAQAHMFQIDPNHRQQLEKYLHDTQKQAIYQQQVQQQQLQAQQQQQQQNAAAAQQQQQNEKQKITETFQPPKQQQQQHKNEGESPHHRQQSTSRGPPPLSGDKWQPSSQYHLPPHQKSSRLSSGSPAPQQPPISQQQQQQQANRERHQQMDHLASVGGISRHRSPQPMTSQQMTLQHPAAAQQRSHIKSADTSSTTSSGRKMSTPIQPRELHEKKRDEPPSSPHTSQPHTSQHPKVAPPPPSNMAQFIPQFSPLQNPLGFDFRRSFPLPVYPPQPAPPPHLVQASRSGWPPYLTPTSLGKQSPGIKPQREQQTSTNNARSSPSAPRTSEDHRQPPTTNNITNEGNKQQQNYQQKDRNIRDESRKINASPSDTRESMTSSNKHVTSSRPSSSVRVALASGDHRNLATNSPPSSRFLHKGIPLYGQQLLHNPIPQAAFAYQNVLPHGTVLAPPPPSSPQTSNEAALSAAYGARPQYQTKRD